MKEWFYTLICIGFFGIAPRLLLPGGEKSKLYPPLRFLISLLLVLTVFTPLFKIKTENADGVASFFEALSSPNTEEMERSLLERSAKEMMREAQAAFPEADFTLYIYTDEYSIPTEISIECADGDGDKIAHFLEEKYGISAEEYKQREDENGANYKNE